MESNKYVVLDVETNGLKSDKHDLLSISIFLPDMEKEYVRFLPLKLNKRVYASITKINGINDATLVGAKHLTQDEFNYIANEYHLFDRTILHFGKIDKVFLEKYLKRCKITGFSKLKFHDIKTHFVTSSFSDGVFTKDNLCRAFGINGVTDIHSGINDCKLEWKLLEKIDGKYVLCLPSEKTIGLFNFFEITDDYYIPASEIRYFPNLKYAKELPPLRVKYEVVKQITYSNKYYDDLLFGFQPLGVASEKVIGAMLNAKDQPRPEFLSSNFAKLKYLACLNVNTNREVIDVEVNKDGSLSAKNKRDELYVKCVNKSMNEVRKNAVEMIDYIKHNVFNDRVVKSQELVVNDELQIFGFTDFSNDDVCLEMKFGNSYVWEGLSGKKYPITDRHRYQYYVLSNGRPMYLLVGNASYFILYKLSFVIGDSAKKRIVNRTYLARKVLCYDRKGNYVCSFGSAKEAAEKFGVRPCTIRDVCNGRAKTSSGFRFKYADY